MVIQDIGLSTCVSRPLPSAQGNLSMMGRPFMTPLHRTFPLKQWTDALTSVKCYKLGTDTFSYN